MAMSPSQAAANFFLQRERLRQNRLNVQMNFAVRMQLCDDRLVFLAQRERLVSDSPGSSRTAPRLQTLGGPSLVRDALPRKAQFHLGKRPIPCEACGCLRR